MWHIENKITSHVWKFLTNKDREIEERKEEDYSIWLNRSVHYILPIRCAVWRLQNKAKANNAISSIRLNMKFQVYDGVNCWMPCGCGGLNWREIWHKSERMTNDLVPTNWSCHHSNGNYSDGWWNRKYSESKIRVLSFSTEVMENEAGVTWRMENIRVTATGMLIRDVYTSTKMHCGSVCRSGMG